VVWQGRWRRIADAFAAAGLSLEAGSRVLVHVRARLQPGFGFDLEADDIDLNFSLGDHAARVRAIREELKSKGFYGRQHALPPVRDFLRVCVIAPAGAAGRADFVRVAGPLHEHRLVRSCTSTRCSSRPRPPPPSATRCAPSTRTARAGGSARWRWCGAGAPRPTSPTSPASSWRGRCA
jgi:hypothetical protein